MPIQQRSLLTMIGETIASRDGATGALAPAAFERAVDAWIGGGAATRRPSSTLVLVRVDWTTRGGRSEAPAKRQADKTLRTVAIAAASCLRKTDVLGRVDNATIGILLPSTPAQQATFVAQRVRAAVAERTQLAGFPVTVSLGLATALVPDTWNAALRAIDQAVASGGDRIVTAQVDAAA